MPNQRSNIQHTIHKRRGLQYTKDVAYRPVLPSETVIYVYTPGTEFLFNNLLINFAFIYYFNLLPMNA